MGLFSYGKEVIIDYTVAIFHAIYMLFLYVVIGLVLVSSPVLVPVIGLIFLLVVMGLGYGLIGYVVYELLQSDE